MKRVRLSPTSVVTIACAALLSSSFAAAQSCYFPDGTPSKDVACDNAAVSPCCGVDAFCLANGLCFESGSMTRGSCTDKTWSSSSCPSICTSTTPNNSVPVIACEISNNNISYGCGFGESACDSSSDLFYLSGSDSIVLRPAQVADLVGPVLNSLAASVNTSSDSTSNGTYSKGDGYSAGALAGVACGVAIPLLIALGVSLYFLQREKRRKPKLLYQVDAPSKEEFTFRAPDAVDKHRSFSQPLDSTRLGELRKPSVYSDNLSSGPATPNGMVSPLTEGSNVSRFSDISARPSSSQSGMSHSHFQQQRAQPPPHRNVSPLSPQPQPPNARPQQQRQPRSLNQSPPTRPSQFFLTPQYNSPGSRSPRAELDTTRVAFPNPPQMQRPQQQRPQNFDQDNSLIQLDLPPPTRYELGPRMSEDSR